MTERSLERSALEVVQALVEQGHTAYYAGGCVRDRLLGVPSKDIDIATSATPEQVQKLFEHTIPVGVQFGVVIVVWEGFPFEVTTFRQDLDYVDGRHPQGVRFVSAREDAERRDFTINGMFYDPLQKNILDYVGGQEDLKKKIIRAIGNPQKRFEEDKLRMLRAVRFASRLNYSIVPETYAEIVKQAADITQVSAERIREECLEMLRHPRRVQALELLESSGLFEHVWPWELSDTMKQVLDCLPESIPVAVALAVLCEGQGPAAIQTLVARLKLSNHLKRSVRDILEARKQIEGLALKSPGQVKWILQQPLMEDALTLYEAFASFENKPCKDSDFARNTLAELRPEELRPVAILQGKHLLEWGYQAGPRFADMLHEVYLEQLEGKICNLEDAKRYVEQHLS